MGKVRKEKKEEGGGKESVKTEKDTNLFDELFGKDGKDLDAAASSTTKAKKERRPRPKVNYDLLASADGLPLLYKKVQSSKINPDDPYESIMKMRRLVEEWQLHLIPAFNFDDFLDKTEGLSGNRHVKRLLDALIEGRSLEDLQEEEAQNEGERHQEVADNEQQQTRREADTNSNGDGDDNWTLEELLGQKDTHSESDHEDEDEDENIPLFALLVKNPQSA